MKRSDTLSKLAVKDLAKTPPHGCGVCGAPATRPFLSVGERDYRRCDCCMATFLDPAQWLSPETEYERYQEHRNNSADIGYRRFLSKLAGPLLKRLASGQDGLDYGCGPGPVLAQMLCEAGHNVSLFDPFFFSGPELD